jgi:predicted transposase/invertase (TIGR01784 family)
MDIETGENVISDVEFNFIELPKFNRKESELVSIIDQWVYFIKNAENLNIIPESVKDDGLKHAYEDADKHNWTKAELDAYDYVLMREQDDRGRWALATRRALGKNTKEVSESIAINFLKSGISPEVVAQNTGLSIEEVMALQREK